MSSWWEWLFWSGGLGSDWIVWRSFGIEGKDWSRAHSLRVARDHSRDADRMAGWGQCITRYPLTWRRRSQPCEWWRDHPLTPTSQSPVQALSTEAGAGLPGWRSPGVRLTPALGGRGALTFTRGRQWGCFLGSTCVSPLQVDFNLRPVLQHNHACNSSGAFCASFEQISTWGWFGNHPFHLLLVSGGAMPTFSPTSHYKFSPALCFLE